MFAVITFVKKYRAYLGSAPFKLRVDNRALAWLKTYSMDQSYIGRWIGRLDGYHMIIEHRTRDKHQNADSLSKKTEFYERLEEKQANQSEIKDGFSFLDKETYDKLPLTRWLDKSGHPIPGNPDLPVERRARSVGSASTIQFGTARTYQAGYKQHGSIEQDGERGAGRHAKAP